MPKLTKTYVDSIQPKSREAVYWDSELKCFGLRVKPSGTKSYIVQYRNAERRSRKYTIGKYGSPWTPEEARKKARRVLMEAAGGTDAAEEKAAARYKTKPRGLARVRGGRGIAARTLAVLGAMLEFGVRNGLLTTNPARGVPLYKNQKRERFLSLSELSKLGEILREAERDGVNATAIAVIRMLLLTGARKGEILGLQWKWVNFETGYLNLPDSKTGAKRIPLGAPALELLTARRQKAEKEARDLGEPVSIFVFPATDDDTIHFVGLQKVWVGIRQRADMEDVRLHDLRHSFASVGVASGHSLYMIGKILGHKQTRTTEIYAHLQDDPLRHVTNQTAQQVADAIGIGLSNGTDEQVETIEEIQVSRADNVVYLHKARDTGKVL